MRLHRQRASQRGFTIVELMIATVVLASILTLVTFILVSIGSLYYKGINQSRIQESLRDLTSNITDNLQLSDNTPKTSTARVSGGAIAGVAAYCIGTTRYTYVLDAQIGHPKYVAPPGTPGVTFQHVLWRDTIRSADNCYVANLTAANPSQASDVGNTGLGSTGNATNGTELIAPNSRLTAFIITPSSPYTLTIALAYGDDDLMSHPANGYDTTCTGSVGDQFCSTARVTTTVVQRLTNGYF